MTKVRKGSVEAATDKQNARLCARAFPHHSNFVDGGQTDVNRLQRTVEDRSNLFSCTVNLRDVISKSPGYR